MLPQVSELQERLKSLGEEAAGLSSQLVSERQERQRGGADADAREQQVW
jgi:hypothetical protein